MGADQTCEVMVVGGGPVGLAAAIELGRLGIRTILVERRDGRIAVPKMNHVSARSMEFCRRWGVAEQVKAAGWPGDLPRDVVYVTSLAGFEIARFAYPPYSAAEPSTVSPEGARRCAQIRFDPILLARAAADPNVELRHRTELAEFECLPDEVRCTLDGPGGRQTVTARYMLACDGADSGIRRTLGIGMSGAGRLSSHLNIFFASDGLSRGHGKGCPVMSWLIGPAGQWAT